MPPPCKVCHSSNTERYTQERTKGLSYKRLSELARELGDSISHQAFFRHFDPKHKTMEQRPIYEPPNKKQSFQIAMDLNRW